MKAANRNSLIIASLSVALLAPVSGMAADPVLEKFEKRYLGWKDLCAVLAMKVTTRSGGEREGEAKTCGLMNEDDSGRLRVRVLAPLGARGTEILSHIEAGGDRKQWLYMPATKRPIPVEDSRSEQPFLGTDFSYVDLSINLIDPETLKPSGTGQCGEAACTAFDIPPREGEYKRRAWLMTETGALHHVDVLDGEEIVKRLDIGAETQGEQGYWLPSEVKMQNLRTGSHTEVKYTEIEFDTGLDADYFDPKKIYNKGGRSSKR